MGRVETVGRAVRGAMGGVRGAVREGVRGLAAVGYPSRCWVTGRAIPESERGLGAAVREEIARGLAQAYCRRCGATLGGWAEECGECRRREVGVNCLLRAGVFNGALAHLIKEMKFGGHWELAAVLGPFVLQALELAALRGAPPVEALVPVALHWRRKFTRGFNQAEELAREVARLARRSTGARWPVVGALKRVRATAEQAQVLSATARRENLQGAFMARTGCGLGGKHVWLLDDVCTTGATIHAAATALRKLTGAERPKTINAVVVGVTEKEGQGGGRQ